MTSSKKVNKKSKVSVIYKGINVEEFFNIFKNFKTLPHTPSYLFPNHLLTEQNKSNCYKE